MEKKETKKRGKAKKVQEETSVDVNNIEVSETNVSSEVTAIVKGNKVEKVSKPKKEDISNKMVKCIVVKPFFGVAENKAYFKGNEFIGTIERIEQINNSVSGGRKFNALEVITNDID